jgi:hypothetical protein
MLCAGAVAALSGELAMLCGRLGQTGAALEHIRAAMASYQALAQDRGRQQGALSRSIRANPNLLQTVFET